MSNEVKEGSYGEPWVISYSGAMKKSNGESIKGNKERIVDCVNALSGIADPIGFVKAVRKLAVAAKLVKIHAHQSVPSNSWADEMEDALDNMGEALNDLDASRTNNQNSKEGGR